MYVLVAFGRDFMDDFAAPLGMRRAMPSYFDIFRFFSFGALPVHA
jgi:hypothetical protein